MDVGSLFARLPEGHRVVSFEGRTYGATRSVHAAGRREKVYAEELGGTDVISANLYRVQGRDDLRPCEMPEARVLAFLAGWVPRSG